jgi:hypothetical protein
VNSPRGLRTPSPPAKQGLEKDDNWRVGPAPRCDPYGDPRALKLLTQLPIPVTFRGTEVMLKTVKIGNLHECFIPVGHLALVDQTARVENRPIQPEVLTPSARPSGLEVAAGRQHAGARQEVR